MEEVDKTAIELSEKLNIDKRVIQIALQRGMTQETADSFFFPENQEIENPEELEGITRAKERIIQAITNKEKIAVYGDYDADGITSTAILYKTLKALTDQVSFYIPERDSEGYGLHEMSLSYLQSKKNDLIITVDCGIKSAELIDRYKKKGLSFIITDHHTPDTVVPDTIIVNPKLKSKKVFSELAGVGVAFLLAKSLESEYADISMISDQLLQLAAIGTIADLVVLDPLNRKIVKKGIREINKKPLPGIKALLSACNQEVVDSKVIAFLIAPIINSSGRMESPDKALRLLLSDDPSEISYLSSKLLSINEDRKKIVEKIYNESKTIVLENQYFLDPIIVAENKTWKSGVLGIVAAKLLNEYKRPVILLTEGKEGLYKGSARSIPGYHMFNSLQKRSDLLEAFGGHAQAAGLSIKADNIEKIRTHLNEEAYQMMNEQDFESEIVPDLIISSTDEITMGLYHDLSYLEPFGNGNPEPLFSFANPVSMTVTKIGKLKNHLRAEVRSGKQKIKGVYFNYNEFKKGIFDSNMIFSIGLNEWRNKKSLQLEIKKITEAEKKDVKRLEEDIYSEFSLSQKLQTKDFTFTEKMKYNEAYKLITTGKSIIYSDCEKELLSTYPFLEEYNYYRFNLQDDFSNNFLSVKEFLAEHGSNLLISDTIITQKEILSLADHYFFYSPPGFTKILNTIYEANSEIKIHSLTDNTKNVSLFLDRDTLKDIYLCLQKFAKGSPIHADFENLLNMIATDIRMKISNKQLVMALIVFRELGFLTYCLEGDIMEISFSKEIKKTQLEESRFYQHLMSEYLDC